MTNRFPGLCANCAAPVPAMAGDARKDPATGRWVVIHTTCPVLDADDTAYEAWLARPIEPGMYLLDGIAIKVQPARSDPSRCYAKRLATGTGKGTFVYEAGLIRRLTPDMRMTPADAAEFGKVWGVCCVCGALLTDPESIAQGIGPVCITRI